MNSYKKETMQHHISAVKKTTTTETEIDREKKKNVGNKIKCSKINTYAENGIAVYCILHAEYLHFTHISMVLHHISIQYTMFIFNFRLLFSSFSFHLALSFVIFSLKIFVSFKSRRRSNLSKQMDRFTEHHTKRIFIHIICKDYSDCISFYLFLWNLQNALDIR